MGILYDNFFNTQKSVYAIQNLEICVFCNNIVSIFELLYHCANCPQRHCIEEYSIRQKKMEILIYIFNFIPKNIDDKYWEKRDINFSNDFEYNFVKQVFRTIHFIKVADEDVKIRFGWFYGNELIPKYLQKFFKLMREQIKIEVPNIIPEINRSLMVELNSDIWMRRTHISSDHWSWAFIDWPEQNQII